MKNSASKPQRGGSREGAGRPPLGKTRVNLTLNSDLVERARAKEDNLSGLLDRLLAKWLEG
ncbi:MAG: type II toxin-antitoxin system CcdA family antitoxin [Verrucomicrobiaceae bacterium]|nr:type II toxin-antitoxin system CcdA family antitoxin [Verrucomicrobiaceae bacterium]